MATQPKLGKWGRGLFALAAVVFATVLFAVSRAEASPAGTSIVRDADTLLIEGVAVTEGTVVVRDSRANEPIVEVPVTEGYFCFTVEVADPADATFSVAFRISTPVEPGTQPSGEQVLATTE